MHTVHLAVVLISVGHDGGVSQDIYHISVCEEIWALSCSA